MAMAAGMMDRKGLTIAGGTESRQLNGPVPVYDLTEKMMTDTETNDNPCKVTLGSIWSSGMAYVLLLLIPP